MSKELNKLENYLLFDEQLPACLSDGTSVFKSECPPDKKFKSENLFEFRRGRGDFHASVVAALLALIFLAFFWTQTGWDARKLPDNLSNYIGYQFGITEIEGRAKRLGTILKQSWFVPMLCLMVLVPAALFNLKNSWKVRRWRLRYQQPTIARFEYEKYLSALEFVAYFVLYTLAVPILGYLLATLCLGVYLTWRLGYRTLKWLIIGLVASFAIVLLFRTVLQIKTPNSIWLYDLLPSAQRAFMLTYF